MVEGGILAIRPPLYTGSAAPEQHNPVERSADRSVPAPWMLFRILPDEYIATATLAPSPRQNGDIITSLSTCATH